jgi:hypothetical protein
LLFCFLAGEYLTLTSFRLLRTGLCLGCDIFRKLLNYEFSFFKKN